MKCVYCGKSVPVAITKPEIYKHPWGWAVTFMTEESSDHCWVHDFDSEQEAREFVKTVKVKRGKQEGTDGLQQAK